MAFAGVRDRIAVGLKALSGGLPLGSVSSGGRQGMLRGIAAALGGTLPGSGRDWRREVGDPWENSIVMACLKWQGRTFPSAPPRVTKPGEADKREPVPNHPLPAILDTPNRWYDGLLLWQGTLLSLSCDGNAYWYKLRSPAGKTVGYQYVPHLQICPYWERDNPEPVQGYAYSVNGRMLRLPVEDVIHFRDGQDPRNPRLGLAPLKSVFRELASDNSASTMAAALLINMGIPGAIVSPKTGAGAAEEFTPQQQRTFKRLWRETFTGDGAGDVFAQGIPVDITRLAFSPAELDLGAIRSLPEERVTAVLGIPAVVAGLGAGLDAAGDRNLEAMERWAWRHNIVPTQTVIAGQLTRDASAEGLLAPGERVEFDNSAVPALSEDESERYKRITLAVGGPWLSPNEGRAKNNLPPIDGGDKLYPPKSGGAPGGGENNGQGQGAGQE